MKRKKLSLALCALMLLILSFPALADTGYSGAINPETGEPYDEQSAASSGDRTALSATMYYDWTSHDYVYPIQGTLGEVHVNAADGMVLTTQVYIQTGNDPAVTVYYNGGAYNGSLSGCSSPGEYVVSSQVNGQTRRLMAFTLVGRSTNLLHHFVVPDGFYIAEADRDGESVYLDRYNVNREREGAYVIQYACSSTGQVYQLETTIDRTPPSLAFQGKVDRQGRIRSKLAFSGLEYGDTIYLTRGGEPVTPELNISEGTGTIYDPGTYSMTVTDAAGNAVQYDFIILQYFNLQSWIFFLLVVVIICLVAGYIIFQRKRLKIG